MALHGKNEIKNRKFNIRAPQSFSEIDTADLGLNSRLDGCFLWKQRG